MVLKNALFCLVFAVSFAGSAQNKMPYQIFTKSGKITTYNQMVDAATQNEVILFGEHHDNSIIHWLQLEFTKDLSTKSALVLGAEMIEADNQMQLDQYLNGEINQQAFDTLARLWNNHKTDYKPLVDFAKQRKMRFIATNVPRRYARMVYRGGFETLDTLAADEKKWIAPMPFSYDNNLPGYRKMVEEMGGHGGENLPKAQAIKDATMAHFITENMKKDSIFVHYNGTYHSDFHEGIFWYLKSSLPRLKILTIATVSQSDVSSLEIEHLNKADFIIVTDDEVTKTY